MPRIAVIGAGHWGTNLATNLHAMGRLDAIVENDPDRARAAAQRFAGVPVTSDLAQLLREPIDAVAIATPPHTHGSLARLCLASGKDVFVEKPMAFSPVEAAAVAELAGATGRVLMVGHLLLYQPALAWIRTAIDDGLIGTITGMHQRRVGRHSARDSIGVLWSLAVHDVAVALHLMGYEAEHIEASSGTSVAGQDVRLRIAFGAGRSAAIHATTLWPQTERRLTVWGDEGRLVYDELAQTVVLARAADEAGEIVAYGDPAPLRLELEHFVRCVRDRSEPLSGGFSGVQVTAVLAAAQQQLDGGGSARASAPAWRTPADTLGPAKPPHRGERDALRNAS